MFGIGFTETILIFAVILIVFGPDKLPELSKNLGQFFGKAKHESEKIKREIYNSMHPPADFKHLDNFENEKHTTCESVIDKEELESVKEKDTKTAND